MPHWSIAALCEASRVHLKDPKLPPLGCFLASDVHRSPVKINLDVAVLIELRNRNQIFAYAGHIKCVLDLDLALALIPL